MGHIEVRSARLTLSLARAPVAERHKHQSSTKRHKDASSSVREEVASLSYASLGLSLAVIKEHLLLLPSATSNRTQ